MTATDSAKKSHFGWAATLGVLLGKAKAVALTLLKMKGLVTLASMFVTLLIYSSVLGWGAAALFIALLFVHEMGHVLVNQRQGIPATLPLFIPFVGALISFKKFPRNAEQEAWSALGGPVLGSLGALACLGIWALSGSKLFLWGAAIGFWLNLFNMIPMSPLDGGRIAAAISRQVWYAGLIGMALLGLWHHEAFFLILACLGLTEINSRLRPVSWHVWAGVAAIMFVAFLTWQAWLDLLLVLLPVLAAYLAWKSSRKGGQAPSEVQVRSDAVYFAVPPAKRAMFSALYLGLAGAFIGALWWVNSLGAFTR